MTSRRRKTLLLISISLILSAVALFGIACSPQDKPSDSETSDMKEAESVSQDFTWSETSDCAICHKEAVASFDDSTCVAAAHADQKADCFSCHDDTQGLTEAHKSVKTDSIKKNTRLKKTSIASTVCTSCHNKAEITENTASSTALTDKNGLTINPHELPDTEKHAEISCSDCHKMHTSEGPADTAPTVCKNCHHAEVFECGTCHVEK